MEKKYAKKRKEMRKKGEKMKDLGYTEIAEKRENAKKNENVIIGRRHNNKISLKNM